MKNNQHKEKNKKNDVHVASGKGSLASNKNQRILSIVAGIVIIAAVASFGIHYLIKSHAEGTSSFILSPTSGTYKNGQTFTVTVSENSGTDQVNAVQMYLTYNSSQLQFNSVTSGSSASSPFTLCGQSSGSAGTVSVACAYPTGTTDYVTGTNTVATISFTMLSTSGSTTISIGSNSDIVLASGQANDWNGTLSSATYNVSLPPLVSMTSPTASSEIHVSQTITASATDQSGTGISKIEFFGNGTLLGTDTASPYTYALNTLTLADSASYALTAEAFDNSGNSTTSSPVDVCINNGDVNNDGTINVTDLSAMAANWGLANGTFAQGNVDNQPSVNVQDLSVLAENWGFTCG